MIKHCLLVLAGLLLFADAATAVRPKKLKVGLVRCGTKNGFSAHGRLAAFCRLIDRHPDLDVLVAPEWFLVPGTTKELHSGRSMARIRRVLEDKTRGKKLLVIPGSIAWQSNGRYKNTTLAISNGKTLIEYSKRQDGGDSMFANRVAVPWRAGKKQGLFKWQDLNVGVEICNDHFYGRLAAENPALDLYVVIASANVDTMYEHRSPTRLNGPALYCNGSFGRHDGSVQAIKQRGTNTVERYTETGSLPPAKKIPLNLSIFDIPLDPKQAPSSPQQFPSRSSLYNNPSN